MTARGEIGPDDPIAPDDLLDPGTALMVVATLTIVFTVAGDSDPTRENES